MSSRLLPLALLLAACGTSTTPPPPLDIPDDPDCDPLIPEVCAMPFPSSKWLAPDDSRVTGYTLTFGPTTLPANSAGIHVDPEPYLRLDGFGVGVPVQTFFDGVDASLLPDETRIAESVDVAASPILLFEVGASGLEVVPSFAEIDQTAAFAGAAALTIRPAVILKEATRYVVALRDLRRVDDPDAGYDGSPFEPSDAFRALRDHLAEGTPVADRIARFEEIFSLLGEAGVPRDGLLLAFDWVTASSEAMHGPLLHMRDDAFATLGAASPAFTIDSITPYQMIDSPDVAYEVLGTFAVPDYMQPKPIGSQTGYRFHLGADGLPEQNGTYQAEFRARIPWSALDGTPHGVIVHGHGLNGTHSQISKDTFDQIANTEHFVFVGCNMIGMSHEDVTTIIEMLGDLSEFPALTERLHQGVLNHAFLARAMKVGFDQVPEIAALGVVIDPSQLYYNGISQGGIYGGTHMAVSLDFERGHLGVPGNDYSTLLQRSADFGVFFVALSSVYSDARDQQVLLSTIQNLWDSVDPVSHYRHLSLDPFPGTPSHQVLLAQAKGDWQVSNLTNEIAARSDLGIALLANYGRPVALVTETPYPITGSGVVSYDFGNPWAPPGNLPPFDDVGDPHNKPRSLPAHNQQMLHFYRTGEIIDVCGGDACAPD